ncbi:MAG TPA: hypothetical protein VGE36_04525 [Roseateles sp.]
MSADPYAVDPKRASAYARRLVCLTPPNLPVPIAIGGALTYLTAMAFDDAELARRTANALRLIAADLDQRAAALGKH